MAKCEFTRPGIQTCGCNPGKFQWLHQDLTVNDDGGFSVWASCWYVAGWPAPCGNPRRPSPKSVSSHKHYYTSMFVLHMLRIKYHKIVHELHAAVLRKKHVAGHIDMKLKQTSLRFACWIGDSCRCLGFTFFIHRFLNFNYLNSLPFFGEAAHNLPTSFCSGPVSSLVLYSGLHHT